MPEKMLRVRLTEEQFNNLEAMSAVYGLDNISDYVRTMAAYFAQHRPTIVTIPRSVKVESVKAFQK